MSDIIIGKDTVKLTITYEESFSNDVEMIEAVKGATELRGLIPEKPCPNELEPE